MLGPISSSGNIEWFAVHTWSRHEKSVFEQLRAKQIEAFLPLYRSSKRWKNGQTGSQLPLFPGYLFVQIDTQHLLPVLQTSGVARFVCFSRKPAAIPEEEIAQLKVAIQDGVAVSPHPYLTAGDRVRIMSGPLAGLTGILTRVKSDVRIILSVESIFRSISVELNISDVEFISTAQAV